MSYYGNITTRTLDLKKLEKFLTSPEVSTMIKLLGRDVGERYAKKTRTTIIQVLPAKYLYVETNTPLKRQLYNDGMHIFTDQYKLNSIEVDLALHLILYYFYKTKGEIQSGTKLRIFCLLYKTSTSKEIKIKKPKKAKIFNEENISQLKVETTDRGTIHVVSEAINASRVYKHEISLVLNALNL